MRKDGEVEIQITRPEFVTPRKAVYPEAMEWKRLRPVFLGEFAKAYRTNGEKMEPNTVLKALSEPKGVAVFVRYTGDKLAKPHLFYLAMLHKDTCVLMVDAGAVLELEP